MTGNERKIDLDATEVRFAGRDWAASVLIRLAAAVLVIVAAAVAAFVLWPPIGLVAVAGVLYAGDLVLRRHA